MFGCETSAYLYLNDVAILHQQEATSLYASPMEYRFNSLIHDGTPFDLLPKFPRFSNQVGRQAPLPVGYEMSSRCLSVSSFGS